MQVGFIGLGQMGGGMVANLKKAGHALVIHDLKRAAAERHLAAGATWADSPRAVAATADVVFLSLPAPPDVTAVAMGPDGVLSGIGKDQACFDLSTNSVATVRALHAAFLEKGAHFLDAPVSGGPAGAASGKLAIWVGGERRLFDAHKAELDSMSDQASYIGAIGAGTIAKLTHNCAGAAINCVLAEVFTMGIKAGVDPVSLWAAVRQGASGRARVFDRLGNHFLTGQYDPPPFALRLLHKDVSLATQLGREVDVPMRMTNLALQELTEAMNRGWGARGSSSFMLLQQERAGIPPLAVDPADIRAVLDSEAGSNK
ncbi:MAG: NAD(P)-dependent oxidoreductase [Alphaproteobacteria bacterium]|nr:NAD(P)-dependent oxidoreductase [Alphaproteobacteria bacterium]